MTQKLLLMILSATCSSLWWAFVMFKDVGGWALLIIPALVSTLFVTFFIIVESEAVANLSK